MTPCPHRPLSFARHRASVYDGQAITVTNPIQHGATAAVLLLELLVSRIPVVSQSARPTDGFASSSQS